MIHIQLGAMLVLTLLFTKTSYSQNNTNMVLVNHVGYEQYGEKKVIFQTASNINPKAFNVVDHSGKIVFKGNFKVGGRVDSWHTGNVFAGLFDKVEKPGKYFVEIDLDGKKFKSSVFEITKQCL